MIPSWHCVQVAPSASPEPAGRASADTSAGTSILGSRATASHPGQSSAGAGMPSLTPPLQQNGGQGHDRLWGSDAAESSLTQAEIEAQVRTAPFLDSLGNRILDFGWYMSARACHSGKVVCAAGRSGPSGRVARVCCRGKAKNGPN